MNYRFMKYAVEMGSGAMIYIPSFIKTGSGIHTDTQHGDVISIFFFFYQNKECMLNNTKFHRKHNVAYLRIKKSMLFKEIHSVIPSSIHQWLYSPFLGPGLFFSSVIFFYTVGRTPWASDQLVARPLPTHRTTQTQNKRIHRHSCLQWDSNPRSQCLIGGRQSMFIPRGHCDRQNHHMGL
jgi:hypothetical protein